MRRGSLTLFVNRYLSIVESSIEEDIPHKLKLPTLSLFPTVIQINV